jgi:hypothetical protein
VTLKRGVEPSDALAKELRDYVTKMIGPIAKPDVIQFTDARPDTGGLSGATPDEAVSWGKIKPDELKHSVVIYSDSTIALPILFGYVLQSCPRRKSKRLFDKTPGFVQKLKKELSTDVLGF